MAIFLINKKPNVQDSDGRENDRNIELLIKIS